MPEEVSRVLGQQVAYPGAYAPEILVAIARGQQRELAGLDAARVSVGQDFWRAYELSWLDARGMPQGAVGTMAVPADSPCLIESKSLKLYFNSLNQTCFESAAQVQATVTADLSKVAGSAVVFSLSGLSSASSFMAASDFTGICLDALSIEMSDSLLGPGDLARGQGHAAETVYTNLFRSNCLVTGQPDWASVAITYVGCAIDHASLLRYLLSYRAHCAFHEQCVERIFSDIYSVYHPDTLTVEAQFTRRGGLDISPIRSTAHAVSPKQTRQIRQ